MALIEGCKHELEITVPVEAIDEEIEKVAAGIQKKAHLTGFRPGKAPLSFIKKAFDQRIRQDVLDNLLDHYFRKQAAEQRLAIVGNPSVPEIKWDPGEPIVFKAVFEVAPTIELKEYTGLTVEYADPVVNDEEVDERLANVRNQKAEYVNQDPRPAETGDVAVIDLVSVAGLEGPPLKAQGMQIELGEVSTMKEFSENIPGMEPGDEKRITVVYPEEYGQERLAGQTVEFNVKLQMLQKKELPELNDEFAKDLGDFQSFAELRDTVRGNLLREKEVEARRIAKQALIAKAADLHDFSVPEFYVDQQLDIYINRFFGERPDKNKIDRAKVKEAMGEQARREVRQTLLLDRIAEKEAINAMQDELDREIQRQAKQERQPAAAVRKKWTEDGTLQRLAHAIRTEKTLNFLFDNARKEAPKDAPEEAPPAEA